MASRDFIRQMEGYGLTTAKILYRMPDYPAFLQTYIWQEYDLAPRFPVLIDFLEFWKRELAGPLHSVTVTPCAADQARGIPRRSGRDQHSLTGGAAKPWPRPLTRVERAP